MQAYNVFLKYGRAPSQRLGLAWHSLCYLANPDSWSQLAGFDVEFTLRNAHTPYGR